MACPNCLDDRQLPFVIDTSVVINLVTTRYAEQILQAFPNRFVIPDDVSLEIEHGRRKQYTTADSLNTLVQRGRIFIVSLGPEGRSHFSGLVAGRACDTIDDGEAATIASALERGGVAIIDERKALRLCAERFTHLRTAHTVDLLTHRNVRGALGHHRLADALFNALYHGRMRVPHTYVEFVVHLIGPNKASMCSTLPTRVSHRPTIRSAQRSSL